LGYSQRNARRWESQVAVITRFQREIEATLGGSASPQPSAAPFFPVR